MKKSSGQDAKKLNSIIKSLSNIKKAFEQNNITSVKNLLLDEITQAACTQFITNIEEAKKRLQDDTRDKLVELNRINLTGARNIASHDYDSIDFDIIFTVCYRLTRPIVLAETYGVLAALEQAEQSEGEENG